GAGRARRAPAPGRGGGVPPRWGGAAPPPVARAPSSMSAAPPPCDAVISPNGQPRRRRLRLPLPAITSKHTISATASLSAFVALAAGWPPRGFSETLRTTSRNDINKEGQAAGLRPASSWGRRSDVTLA